MDLKCDAVVPGLGCEYVASGDTPEAVKDAMMVHGAEAHANLMADVPEGEREARHQEMGEHISQLIAAL